MGMDDKKKGFLDALADQWKQAKNSFNMAGSFAGLPDRTNHTSAYEDSKLPSSPRSLSAILNEEEYKKKNFPKDE